MPELSLGLALYNLLPVALTGVALWFLARYAAERDPASRWLAMLGGGLILAGGLSKATWKLIAAASGDDIVWLGNALFPLMAPGFALLALALLGAVRRQRGRPGPVGLWRAGLAVVVLTFVAAGIRQWMLDIPRGWFLPLLTLASLGNLASSLLLIGVSLSLRHWGTAFLFGINLAMIFALQPIALATPKTIAMHWLEQSVTAFGTACFALAALRLWRMSRAGAPTGPA